MPFSLLTFSHLSSLVFINGNINMDFITKARKDEKRELKERERKVTFSKAQLGTTTVTWPGRKTRAKNTHSFTRNLTVVGAGLWPV